MKKKAEANFVAILKSPTLVGIPVAKAPPLKLKMPVASVVKTEPPLRLNVPATKAETKKGNKLSRRRKDEY